MQTITGRVTGQAKVKETKSGKKVTEFTVVLNDSYRPKNQDERVQLSTFYECSYWGSPKVAPYLKKGTIVTLSGRIGASAWINKEGKAVATLTCTVFNLKTLQAPSKNMQQIRLKSKRKVRCQSHHKAMQAMTTCRFKHFSYPRAQDMRVLFSNQINYQRPNIQKP